MIKDHLGDQVLDLQDHRVHLNIASTRSLGRSGKAASYSARVLGNKSTGWRFDDHLWPDYCDDKDDDASEMEDSYGVSDGDKRAKGGEKGMWLTIQGDDRNENSDDDDNAGEKANGEEKALIPKELNCQEAPRSNWAMSTILGRASASSSLFFN